MAKGNKETYGRGKDTPKSDRHDALNRNNYHRRG